MGVLADAGLGEKREVRRDGARVREIDDELLIR